MNAGNKKIHLKSTENEIVETTMKCALMSNTIKDMLEAIGDDSDEKCLEVPIDTVSTATLKKCVEWMTKWQDQPQPTSEEIKDKLAERIDLWDEDFLKMDLIDLYNLITASNFLNIPGLLWLTTREVAYLIKGKTPEEIREFFHIQNDWTPEELEQVQKENQWCEEK